LSEIAKITNHQSNNLYAENIYLYLSLQNEKNKICTNGNSHIAITSFWSEKGVDTKHLFQVDGSGMSMKNAISPKHIVDILEYMQKKSSHSRAFTESIPIAGKKGTVVNFMKNTPLAGKAHVKSGSMERVQNYAGYIQKGDKWYAFCIMVSNFGGQRSTVIKQISTLLNEIMNSL
jgi:D-alanyl-D-alanine carboxypeptidase/D-alanyl-D-alanine-endopeptidase (penicillin-binding protein 4)